MERFWKAALAVAGLGAVGSFVFLSLYKQWLSLPIFSQVNPDQTFVLMLVFLGLTFLALVVCILGWLKKGVELEEAALHRLEQAWIGVKYIDCKKLIGPDVNVAANALQMTSIYWRKGFISKNLIMQKYGQDFSEVFNQIDSCDKQVPGYNDPKKFCKDFLPAIVRSTYLEMKKYGA